MAASGAAHIAKPEPSHVRQRRQPQDDHQQEHDDSDDDDREATELHDVTQLPALSHILTSGKQDTRWHAPIRKFWRHQIRITVPHVDCRDHLANERTFLGYMRTSVAFSMLGVAIAQLYRLSPDTHPNPVFGYFVLSKPLAAVFLGSAIGIMLIGSFRFWRQQNAMARGKVHAGGWEVMLVCVFVLLLMLMMLAVHIGIPAYQASIHDGW